MVVFIKALTYQMSFFWYSRWMLMRERQLISSTQFFRIIRLNHLRNNYLSPLIDQFTARISWRAPRHSRNQTITTLRATQRLKSVSGARKWETAKTRVLAPETLPTNWRNESNMLSGFKFLPYCDVFSRGEETDFINDWGSINQWTC